MTQDPGKNDDPTLYCKYFGGPRDGFMSGDMPPHLSGKKLTGIVMKIPLGTPVHFSVFAVYTCTSETQIDGFWEFHFQGFEGPDGEKMVAETPTDTPADAPARSAHSETSSAPGETA